MTHISGARSNTQSKERQVQKAVKGKTFRKETQKKDKLSKSHIQLGGQRHSLNEGKNNFKKIQILIKNIGI